MPLPQASLHRSETLEQREYEEEMLKQHEAPLNHHDEPSDKSTEESFTLKEGKSVRRRVKGFSKNLVKTAFPDLSIIRAAFAVEAAVTKDLRDTTRYPEVAQVAEVRRGLELCVEEREFLSVRRDHVREAFAKYLNLDPNEVHADDVPVIGFGGSGGGFRAMIGVLGYCHEMKEAGLWDLFTYVAGVSGSCWSLAAYYTFGEASMSKVIEHCKKRLYPHHPLSLNAIRKVLTAPGGPYATLGPLVQKHRSGLKTVAMDLYSVFTTGYVFLHDDPALTPGGPGKDAKKEVAGYHHYWYKWSNALSHIQGSKEPLPILTAIRHERPWKDWVDPEHPFMEPDPASKEQREAQDSWFQWFEMTPFEVGSDELEAWVPTWGFGRPYSGGKSVMQLPEQSLALLLGLCTSAPAGPLTSYIATIKRNLPQGFIGNSIQSLAHKLAEHWGKQGTQEFQQHHPLHASNEHNFMYHFNKGDRNNPKNTPSVPIENSPRIHLIDGGMDNNCPTYVLLHPSREIDVILNMDASSDVQKDSFQERVDQIGCRRKLRFTKRHPEPNLHENPNDADRFNGLYAQIYDSTMLEKRPATVVDSYGHTVTNPPAPASRTECTMVYMPLLPNEKAVPGFDPSTAKFSGSYNLVWTPDQVEMLVKVCSKNFRDGEETIKVALTDAWKRKKAKREGRLSQ